MRSQQATVPDRIIFCCASSCAELKRHLVAQSISLRCATLHRIASQRSACSVVRSDKTSKPARNFGVLSDDITQFFDVRCAASQRTAGLHEHRCDHIGYAVNSEEL